MLLKGNVTIRAQGKKSWRFFTHPNQIGQYVPGVETIETVAAHRKQNQASAEIDAVSNPLTALGASLSFSNLQFSMEDEITLGSVSIQISSYSTTNLRNGDH